MFARTPRLLLRPGWADDAAALSQALNDEAVARNLPHVPYPYGMTDAERFLALPHESRFPRLLVFSRTHAAPRLVGGCALLRGEKDSALLGYWIARPYWGLGFATEAARALMQTARGLGHARILAEHSVDNPASGRVLRKLGFRPTGDFVRRFSVVRNEEGLAALYEEAGEDDMRADLARELYEDAASVLAA